jgi:hypothetical protein
VTSRGDRRRAGAQIRWCSNFLNAGLHLSTHFTRLSIASVGPSPVAVVSPEVPWASGRDWGRRARYHEPEDLRSARSRLGLVPPPSNTTSSPIGGIVDQRFDAAVYALRRASRGEACGPSRLVAMRGLAIPPLARYISSSWNAAAATPYEGKTDFSAGALFAKARRRRRRRWAISIPRTCLRNHTGGLARPRPMPSETDTESRRRSV